MTAAKQKGTRAESAVVAYLRANGYPHAERRALSGNKDKGDVAGVPGVAIEVKSAIRLELAAWLDEAARERENAGSRLGVVWFKRRGKTDPGKWFVTMDGATFLELLREADAA